MLKFSTATSSRCWSSDYNVALFSILGGIVVAEGKGKDKLEEKLEESCSASETKGWGRWSTKYTKHGVFRPRLSIVEVQNIEWNVKYARLVERGLFRSKEIGALLRLRNPSLMTCSTQKTAAWILVTVTVTSPSDELVLQRDQQKRRLNPSPSSWWCRRRGLLPSLYDTEAAILGAKRERRSSCCLSQPSKADKIQ